MIDFDCTRFQRWLDEDGATAAARGPCAADQAAAHLHAAGCGPCGAALAAEEGLARLLGAPAAAPAMAHAPPDAFVERVMARVAVTPQERPALAPTPDPLPWWVRVAAQPATALAFALAGVAVLFAPRLGEVARVAPAWGAGAATALSAVFARQPDLGPALALGLLPLFVLAAPAAYRLGEGLATPRPASPAAGPAARPAAR